MASWWNDTRRTALVDVWFDGGKNMGQLVDWTMTATIHEAAVRSCQCPHKPAQFEFDDPVRHNKWCPARKILEMAKPPMEENGP